MTEKSKRPNLLFIMTDQQKATSLDLYNSGPNAIETTSLRRLAEMGTTFQAGYCPYPLCVPSRITMLSGVYPSSSGFIGNGPYMGDRFDTIFSRAKDEGYHTMLVGKDHAYATASIGGDPGNHPEFMDAIFDRMYCALHNGYQPPEIERDLPEVRPWLNGNPALQQIWGSDVAPWNADRSVTARLCEVADEWLGDWETQGRPDGTPFAMWLSFPDPHEYYQAPKDVFESIDPASIDLPPNWESDIGSRSEYIQFMHWYFNAGGVPEETVLKLIRVYLAMCKNVDLQLNRVLDRLERMGELENTLIVYTSDHGDFNGEHQLIQKFNCGYDGCCRVPLILAFPGRGVAGRLCPDPVNLADLPSTICEALDWKPLAADQGRSLADMVFSETYDPRDYTVIESGVPGESLTRADIANFPNHRYDRMPVGRWSYDPPHRFGGKLYAVRSRDYKLITRQDQRAEFFDMKNDPWETNNRIDEPALQDEIFRHTRFLVNHLARIACRQPDVIIAKQDDWYRAGGSQTWEECLPPEIAKGS
jgi:arylsulfatase A-like enzyme